MTGAAAEPIRARPWRHATPPRRILAIRLQALGDTIITLPYLLGVRRRYPDAELHFLTREEVAAVPRAMGHFDRVVALAGDRNRVRTWLSAARHMPTLVGARYDVVLDLQNSRLSNFVRRMVRPAAWSSFDRFSPRSAGERTRRTIEAALGVDARMQPAFELRGGGPDTDALLRRHGWKHGFDLVVLNPAGFAPSRAWPTASYIEFARLWLERHPRSQIVLLLLPAKRAKATEIAAALGEHCVDLTGRADQLAAFTIVGRARLVLSEDGGLMHMAWTQGTPTLALFSDSRRDWSAPQGSWSDCLDSSDLPCGQCGLAVCKFGDNRCLTRYSAAEVLERAERLVRPRLT
ncbi:MAG TPA: glycosyltransferase family 9 protein [Steroidobacteraceae bacterium]|nr:glycosyltransferase family 9 protein [Steroidobacteraceae bacterium]